jgi:hydroxymethylpyrimidine/phosphomethylpyrimidine kinase
MACVLTIAGSDPSGGAGIQADLKTLAALDVHGASAITAITVQSTGGVSAVVPLSADLVSAQIEAVASDLQIDATKLGMLATAAIVEAAAAAIDALELPSVVLDPVIAASSGPRLLDDDGVQALCLELLPRARVVTPNIPEAEALSGCRIRSEADRRRAATRLLDMGVGAVVITGGHATGTDVVDLLYDGDTFVELRTLRVDGPPVHGTGCAFATAIAAGLARGQSLAAAAGAAQQFVAGAIAHARRVGAGPPALDHFWNLRLGASARARDGSGTAGDGSGT